MFKLIILSAILSISSSFASGTEDHGSHSKEKLSTRLKLDKKTKLEVASVLKANDDLHTAFFSYDSNEVDKAARVLEKEISKISNSDISKVLKFSQTKLSKITAKAKRDDNNQNYHLVSMALIHIVNKYDVGSTYNAYSCPMVKKKWIQNSTVKNKLNNPYASGMPHCGAKDTNY